MTGAPAFLNATLQAGDLRCGRHRLLEQGITRIEIEHVQHIHNQQCGST